MLPLLRLALLFAAVVASAAAESPLLRIVGPERTVELSPDDWQKLPRSDVSAVEPHASTAHRYSGVAVRDLLRLAGAPLEGALRGPALRTGVLVRARDGYVVLFSLAEFDAAFSSRTLLLADRVDDQPLREHAAPLQLIAEGDRRGARWVRMVTSLELVSVVIPSAP